MVIELKPNEFTDYTDPVGFFEQEYDPVEFLTLASKTTQTSPITGLTWAD